jgi:hypothetical protein
MKLDRTQRTWGLGTGAAMLGSLLLAGLSFGTPESMGCGGAVPIDDSVSTSAGVAIGDGALASRLASPVKMLLVWDLPDGSAWKFGEGKASGNTFTLNLAPPPDDVVHGAVGIAHLVAVAPDKVVADGPLSSDDGDDLAQNSTGVVAGAAVLYKQSDSDALPWLAAFPLGVSCAKAVAPGPGSRTAGGAPLGGYVRVACKGLAGALIPVGEDAFVNWSEPLPVGRRLGR